MKNIMEYYIQSWNPNLGVGKVLYTDGTITPGKFPHSPYIKLKFCSLCSGSGFAYDSLLESQWDELLKTGSLTSKNSNSIYTLLDYDEGKYRWDNLIEYVQWKKIK